MQATIRSRKTEVSSLFRKNTTKSAHSSLHEISEIFHFSSTNRTQTIIPPLSIVYLTNKTEREVVQVKVKTTTQVKWALKCPSF